MKQFFVKTDNLQRLMEGAQMLSERGAREAAWMLVTGRPGEGKTTTLYNWGAQNGAAFLTMQQGWTPGRMTAELAAKIGLPVTARIEVAIGERLAEHETTVILDEAQFALPENAACLERLRGITDKSGTAVILVAMERDVWRFSQREQISSRIFNWVEFKPASADDVATACQQLAEVQIGADLVKRIHADTGGRMRNVLNAISRIEMAAKGLGKATVNATDVRRLTLCEDYRRAHESATRGGRASA